MWRARFGSAVVALWVAMLAYGTPVASGAPSSAPVSRAGELAAREIVLLEPPAPLERALRTALSPWGVRLQIVARQHPGTTLPGTALQAGQLARELGARTLVWISSDAAGSALWIYEAQSDTIRARAFQGRSLDGALAAALALSVKTWLRSDVPRAAPAAVQTPPLPEPAAVVHAPLAEPGADGGSGDAEPAPWSRVLVSVAARQGALEQGPLEARYAAELRVSPGRAEVAPTRFWIGARFEAGTQSVSRPAFRGNFSDRQGGLSAGVVQQLAPLLAAGLHGGLALHHSVLSGTLPPAATPVDVPRWAVSAQVRPELELDLGALGVVLQSSLGVPLRKRAYTVDGVETLGAGAVWWALGGGLRFDLL